MSLLIKVTDYDDLRGHVEYTVEVRDLTGESWCFKRRYSALRFFHELIKKSEKRVPNFPPKKLFGNLNPDFLENRRKQIEQYFNALVHIPEILHSSAFKDFIRPFDKAPIIRNKKNQKKIFTKETTDAIATAIGRLIDEANLEFVDLSPFMPAPEDLIVKVHDEYLGALLNISLPFPGVAPKVIPENANKLLKGKCDFKKFPRAFLECLDILKTKSTKAEIFIEY